MHPGTRGFLFAATLTLALCPALSADGESGLAQAGNPRSSPKTLAALFNTASGTPHIDPAVLKALAGNPASPVELLEKIDQFGMPFSSTIYFPVYAALAGNANTPPRILERLASFPDTEVKKAAAANPSTPRKALKRMAGDKEAEVRLSLCLNPRLDRATLKILAKDENAGVREKAAKRSAK